MAGSLVLAIVNLIRKTWSQNHTHSFQISVWGCRILPWSWESRSCLIGISQGTSPYRRGISSENHVWDGQNGATSRRRTPLSYTGLPESAWQAEMCTASFPAKGERAHLCPEVPGNSGGTKVGIGTTPVMQRGPLPLCRTNPGYCLMIQHPLPNLSFGLDRKSAARFKTPGTWTALKERNLSWVQRRRLRACLFRVRDREPPWWFIWDTTAMLSILTITRKWISARKTALSSRQFMCQERNSPVQTPHAGLSSKTAPQPVRDASVVTIWQPWIAPFWLHYGEKGGSPY